MDKLSIAGNNIRSRIYWVTMFLGALAALGFGARLSLEFTVVQIFCLAILIAISGFLSQHQLKIPKTSAIFSARGICTFWAAVWLGPGAAAIAGLVGYAARYGIEKREKSRWSFRVFSATVAAFAGALVYHAVIGHFGIASAAFFESTAGAVAFIVGVVGMAFVNFTVGAALNSIFLYLDGETAGKEIVRFEILRPVTSCSATLLGFSIIHGLFLQFGLSFGLVLLPLAIVAHFAFRFHINRLKQKTLEIGEAGRIHMATVEALATAIDARDQVGVGHVRRTQIFAVGMGRTLELSSAEIDALNTGALLHDIGKLAVPDHILNKPGRLTPAEMEKTKIHSSVGASILEKVKFNTPVVPTVKYHHECWDGSGYPDGLKGNAIPLTARIIAVADAYDTLRGARPYRAAVSREEARRFLINGAGTQFDPRIVDVFLRNLKKYEQAIENEGLSYAYDSKAQESLPMTGSRDTKSYVEQIKRANREVFTLYELARIFSSSLNLEETFSLFAEKIGGLVPFDTCVIYLCDETGQTAKAVYAEGRNAKQLMHRTIHPGEGATGYVLKKRLPVCNVNPGLDFSFFQLDFVQEYSAMASLPLIADEKLLGAVSIYSCALENYEDEHLRLLETVSRIASDAISKSIYHAETETRALTDPMTLLPNARSLQLHFEKEVARADRNGTSFQVLMLDLDGFKAVNDTFGHKAGDKLLRELAKVMKAQLRDYDFLARYAGDEFVAIIPETEDISVEELATRLEKAVNEFVLPIGDGRFAQVGISIGAASFPHGGDTLDQVIVSADKAMYNVKTLRKRLRDQEMERLAEEKRQLQERKMQQIQPEPIPVRPIEVTPAQTEEMPETNSESFVVELDESHIISSAIN